uniref:Uncharacterized protein n=1 Tax=Lactuca sativa TaxID=4236 RepID=A0A9R1VM74_LACSA|nr:hypothetical protein LSAT_V11C500253490 [Lactuca sativa]
MENPLQGETLLMYLATSNEAISSSKGIGSNCRYTTPRTDLCSQTPPKILPGSQGRGPNQLPSETNPTKIGKVRMTGDHQARRA